MFALYNSNLSSLFFIDFVRNNRGAKSRLVAIYISRSNVASTVQSRQMDLKTYIFVYSNYTACMLYNLNYPLRAQTADTKRTDTKLAKRSLTCQHTFW